jgi:hypothetical protein
MTIINNPVSSTTGASTTSVTASVGSDPVGGKLVQFNPGDNYIVPTGYVLHLRRFGFDAPPNIGGTGITGNSSGSLTSITGTLAGKPVITVEPTVAPAAAYHSSLSPSSGLSVPLDLNIQAGESVLFDYWFYSAGTKVDASNRASYSSFQPTGVYMTGYLTVLSSVASTSAYSHAEPEPATWWKPNIIVPYSALAGAAVRAVALGDGLALLIRNGTIDKNTTVINIETGAEVAVYTGTASLAVGAFWFMHAAYVANYSATGKSMLRIAMGAETTTDKGGCTDLLLGIQNSPTATDADFKISTLPNLIYGGLTSGRDLIKGRKILGFAGTDFLVTAPVFIQPNIPQAGGGTAAAAAPLVNGGVSVHNLTTVPIATTSYAPGGANLYSNTGSAYDYGYNFISGPYSYSYGHDNIVRAKGVRGQNGRLYVHLHVCADTTTPAVGPANYSYQIGVIDNTGALIGGFLSPAHQSPFGNTGSYFQAAMAATLGVSTPLATDPAGSEKLLAVVCSGMYAYPDTQTAHYRANFSAAGAPTLDAVYGYKCLGGPAALMIPADFPNLPEAPTAGRLGSYFNSFGMASDYSSGPNTVATFYKSSTQLQSVPGQERRTNGLIYGNTAGWYYPTGLFVEKRSLNDFGVLVGTGAVQTVIQNPVQAIASATKLLVVGVNGQFEIVTP